MRSFPIGLLLIVCLCFNCEKKTTTEPETSTVATPTFSPVPGTYTSAQIVTISCTTTEATIRYTTNGNDPTESDPSYSVPINISTTTTLKAQAYKTGWNASDIAGGTYLIISFDMVFVQGGTFQMGDTFGDGYSDELPVHSVTLRDFYISKYEVTQGLYRSVMGYNPSDFTGDDNKPVEKVSWYSAFHFCNALSQIDGLTPCYETVNGTNIICNFDANGYRLPTEAEWEYAARGGNQSQGYKYSGSDSVDKVAWYDENSGRQTHPVGTKSPNELGLYDMSGNVWEWCWDWYGHYSSSSQTDTQGPGSGSYRVLRGGSWDDGPRLVRCAVRVWDYPDSWFNYEFGFRFARTP